MNPKNWWSIKKTSTHHLYLGVIHLKLSGVPCLLPQLSHALLTYWYHQYYSDGESSYVPCSSVATHGLSGGEGIWKYLRRSKKLSCILNQQECNRYEWKNLRKRWREWQCSWNYEKEKEGIRIYQRINPLSTLKRFVLKPQNNLLYWNYVNAPIKNLRSQLQEEHSSAFYIKCLFLYPSFKDKVRRGRGGVYHFHMEKRSLFA